MHVVAQSEYPIYEGQHEGIVSEEDWELAQAKRKKTSGRRVLTGKTSNISILSTIVKCPCCGKSMYSNTQRPTKKDPKTRFYYYCKNTSTATGHKCTFRTNIEQSQIDNFVAAVISAMVHDPKFENAIKDKIGTVVDTSDLVKELDTLKGKLRQALSIKGRLEQQLDTLPYDDPHYDRKILDLQRRYDDQYDIIELLESQIEDIETQIRDIRQEQISGENVYELLRSFDDLYEELDNSDKRDLMRAIIERVELFPERRKDGCWVKSIVFNFPVPVNGQSIKELSLENETTLETVCLLSRVSK